MAPPKLLGANGCGGRLSMAISNLVTGRDLGLYTMTSSASVTLTGGRYIVTVNDVAFECGDGTDGRVGAVKVAAGLA